MKITVREQILSGNMGDGWGDNYETANRYAEFLAPILEADVLEQYPDAEVVIALSVERASGCTNGIIVDVDDVDDPEQIFEVSDALVDMLSYTAQDAWGIFCDAEAVRDAASTMGRKGGKSKSDAKTAAARENAKKGGRPPLCAECKERCEPGLKPVWMKYRKRDGLWHAIEVPLCIDHRNVGGVRYKGRYCTSAN